MGSSNEKPSAKTSQDKPEKEKHEHTSYYYHVNPPRSEHSTPITTNSYTATRSTANSTGTTASYSSTTASNSAHTTANYSRPTASVPSNSTTTNTHNWHSNPANNYPPQSPSSYTMNTTTYPHEYRYGFVENSGSNYRPTPNIYPELPNTSRSTYPGDPLGVTGRNQTQIETKPFMRCFDEPVRRTPQPMSTMLTSLPQTLPAKKDSEVSKDDKGYISQFSSPYTEEGINQRIQRGFKLLVIIRGLPGSGKTTLAKKFLHKGVIINDNAFVDNSDVHGIDPPLIKDARMQSQEIALLNMKKKTTPIIIDNDNLTLPDMEPYILMALQHRYFVTVIEPDTVWRYDALELTRRNSRHLSYAQITRMLKRFHRGLTYNTILRHILPKLAKEHQVEGANVNEKIGKELPKNDNKSKKLLTETQKRKTSNQENEAEAKTDGGHADKQQTSTQPANDNRQETGSVKTKNAEKAETKMRKKNVVNPIVIPSITPILLPYAEIPKTSVSTGNTRETGIVKTNETETVKNIIKPNVIPSTTPISLPYKEIQEIPMSTDNYQETGNVNTSKAKKMESKKKKKKTKKKNIDNMMLPLIPEPYYNPSSPQHVLSDNMRDLLLINFEVPPNESDKSDFVPSINTPNKNLTTIFNRVPKDTSIKSRDQFETVGQQLATSGDITKASRNENPLSSLRHRNVFSKTPTSKYNLQSSGNEFNLIMRPDVNTMQNVETKAPHELVLRIDLIFAMELEQLFGPVGFRVLPDSSKGNDLDIAVDFNLARKIHSLWSQTVMSKPTTAESRRPTIQKEREQKSVIGNQHRDNEDDDDEDYDDDDDNDDNDDDDDDEDDDDDDKPILRHVPTVPCTGTPEV